LDALSRFWKAFPSLRSTLFKANRQGYSDLAVDVVTVQRNVIDSPEFKQFATDVDTKVGKWFINNRSDLSSIDANTSPSDLIARLGDDLLAEFNSVALLDSYDVYEQLMTYWQDIMHDDVFLVMNEGWLDAAKPRTAIEDKGRKLTETPDLVIGTGRSGTKLKMDLISPSLIVAKYFADEQAKINELNGRADSAARAVEEYTEEYAVEDGPLSAAMDDDKINKALASARLKQAKREDSDPEEIKALEQLINLYDTEAATRKAVKDAKSDLDLATLKKYGELTVDEIKRIVLDDKWHATVSTRVASEVNSLTLNLVSRIRQLGERYAETVEDLGTQLTKLESLVARHLADMGIE
jgi:type I restriction enzyme M protein